jgi:hypothetical protein
MTDMYKPHPKQSEMLREEGAQTNLLAWFMFGLSTTNLVVMEDDEPVTTEDGSLIHV